MQKIDSTVKNEKELSDALRGFYGVERLANGIEVLWQGRLLHFSGFFDGTPEVVEIPKLPARVPVLFSGEDFSCVSVAEPNSGFVKVPETARGKKFVVLGDCALNT